MLRIVAVSILHVFFCAPVYAQSMEARIADERYDELSEHILNFQRAFKDNDDELGCSELNNAMSIVRLNFTGLQEISSTIDWYEWRKSWLPALRQCNERYY